MAATQEEYEAKLRDPSLITNRPPSAWHFPNYESGPLRPRPIHVNHFRINDRFPTYLLCQYDVDEGSYDRRDQGIWFKAALTQVRHFGPRRFPRIKWIAVVIFNRAERKGLGTFEKSFKVGAIFRSGDVFNSWRRLSKLVAQAEMDFHPFYFDQSQASAAEQQRWLIVEQHAATNHIDSGRGGPQKR